MNDKEIIKIALDFIENHITETQFKYIYSDEVRIIQELHLDNEELIELENILKNAK